MITKIRDFFKIETMEDLHRVENAGFAFIIGMLIGLYLVFLIAVLLTFPRF